MTLSPTALLAKSPVGGPPGGCGSFPEHTDPAPSVLDGGRPMSATGLRLRAAALPPLRLTPLTPPPALLGGGGPPPPAPLLGGEDDVETLEWALCTLGGRPPCIREGGLPREGGRPPTVEPIFVVGLTLRRGWELDMELPGRLPPPPPPPPPGWW